MKLTSSFIFLIVLIASALCQETTSPTTESTITSTQTDTTVTTETTAATTTVSSTTANPTTSSTEPSTTTTNPTTTTLATTTSNKPTTTSPDTTTSTPSPTTTPATTTKSPEPPTPVEGSWNVTEGDTTCIRADLKIRFDIVIKDHVDYIVVSPNATSSGNCNLTKTTQELTLEESEYTLTMIFEKDSDVYLKNVTLQYTLPDGSGMVFNDTKLFAAKPGNSYMCDSSSNVNMKNVTMEVFRIRIQAFGNAGNKDFGTAKECEADNKVNDMVPIAVGIALLCLVVVVLIAYFVGRRRSRQKGYQSV